ncbi:hypothetical protein COO60DRAFT_1699592 [Scenedesmus sp. NREL 46B-D3]|nr:hypothetical protein COO60DRAFT_1699592 [Scenedesmus sp. NREL 46B-D3]
MGALALARSYVRCAAQASRLVLPRGCAAAAAQWYRWQGRCCRPVHLQRSSILLCTALLFGTWHTGKRVLVAALRVCLALSCWCSAPTLAHEACCHDHGRSPSSSASGGNASLLSTRTACTACGSAWGMRCMWCCFKASGVALCDRRGWQMAAPCTACLLLLYAADDFAVQLCSF